MYTGYSCVRLGQQSAGAVGSMAFEHVFDTPSLVKLWHQLGRERRQVLGNVITHALTIDEHHRRVHNVVDVDRCVIPWYSIFDDSINWTVIRALDYVSFGLAKSQRSHHQPFLNVCLGNPTLH